MSCGSKLLELLLDQLLTGIHLCTPIGNGRLLRLALRIHQVDGFLHLEVQRLEDAPVGVEGLFEVVLYVCQALAEGAGLADLVVSYVDLDFADLLLDLGDALFDGVV